MTFCSTVDRHFLIGSFQMEVVDILLFCFFFLLDIEQARLLFKVFYSILSLVMPFELSVQTDCCTKGK